MIGRVVSTKMKDTAVVLVISTKTHPLYKKTYIRSKKFLVHSEAGVNLGDMVEIIQVKPYSKKKNWKIQKVVGRKYEEIAKEELKEAAREAIEEVMPEEKESSAISPQSSDKETEEVNKKKKTIGKRKEKSDS